MMYLPGNYCYRINAIAPPGGLKSGGDFCRDVSFYWSELKVSVNGEASRFTKRSWGLATFCRYIGWYINAFLYSLGPIKAEVSAPSLGTTRLHTHRVQHLFRAAIALI